MTQTLATMTQEELSRLPRDEEAGFGCLVTGRGPLPLGAMDVRARIVALTTEIELKQTFDNVHDEPIEATYIFPLPDRAAVTRFRMQVGDRVIDGVLEERGEARRTYDRAIREGRRAAITEEERAGVFTLRVGNLMPGDRATVELTLTGPLSLEGGEATFRFPLVVAPRYVPGTPLPGESVGDGVASDTDAVPDASRITPPVLLPGYPNPVKLSLRVDLDPAGLPTEAPRSSLHAVSESGEGKRRRIELRPGERLDRDFVLRFGVGDEAVRTALALAPDETSAGGEEEAEGTFSVTLVPPAARESERGRDLVFILDRSGSMDGWKVVAARRAVARMIDSLGDRDRFAVLAFDHAVESPPGLSGDSLWPATDRNRFRAVEFLAGLTGRGGTEMAAPLQQATSLLEPDASQRDRSLVLVTDGQVAGEDQILRTLAPRLKGARVFALGIDRAVNQGFLKRLAALGGGSSEMVESEDRLDEVMDRVHRRIGVPIVSELSLEARGLDIDWDSVVPGRLPDLMDGAPVVVRGRYRGAAAGELLVRGQDALGEPFEKRVRGQKARDRAAAPLWARAAVRELEDRYAIGRGDRGALAKRIVDLSRRFCVLSRFTAFVAVDRSEVVNEGKEPRRILQPVELPSGWGSEAGAMDALAASAAPAPMMAAMPPQSAPPAPTMAKRGAGSMGFGPGATPPPAPGAPSAPARMARRSLGRSSATMPPLDLGAYADRLDRILERLRGDAEPSASRRARALAVSVGDLLTDLASVGAPEDLLGPLRELLEQLRRHLASGEGLEEVMARAEETLSRAAERCRGAGPDEPPRRSRLAFWK